MHPTLFLLLLLGVSSLRSTAETEPFRFSHGGGVLTLFRDHPITIDLTRQSSHSFTSRTHETFEEESEFYSQFRCPTGKWIEKYGFTEETMKRKAKLLATFQKAMESCEGYSRPGIRTYVKRHFAYEDPEWVKPQCRDYPPDARNVDHQCVLRNVRANGKHNITEHDGCGKRFKCWPQLMITHQGKFIFRPSYKAGSMSMRDMMKCNFKDFEKLREIWPCDNIYPDSRFTLSEEEQKFAVLHMVRHPFPRFTSALIEQYTRWHNPPQKERYRLGLTKWFPLSEKNASTSQLLNAFLRDTECNIDHPWWPHSATALWHMTEYEYPDTFFDGTGRVPDIDYIFKLEKFESDWETAAGELGVKLKRRCKLPTVNNHDDSKHIGPPKEEIISIMQSNRNLMRRFCAIYIADFVCFDYEVPDVCKDMLKKKVGVCPL